jgi:DNA-directed RNA polymerase subunit RPC12/RpoP
MGSLTPICVKCGRETYCEKNGVYIVHPFEHASGFKEKTIGNTKIINIDYLIEGSWKEGDIDFIAMGDKYKCPNCGYEIVIASDPIMDSQKKLKRILKVARESGKEIIEIRRK